MKLHLTRRYRFSASHRLHSAQLDEQTNQRVYGKCNNPYGHGHNYAVEVTVGGPIDPVKGMICDLGELDALVQREVIDRFDHQNLNAMTEFHDTVPTSENLCEMIFHILKRELRAGHLEHVRLEETSRNSFEYGEGMLR